MEENLSQDTSNQQPPQPTIPDVQPILQHNPQIQPSTSHFHKKMIIIVGAILLVFLAATATYMFTKNKISQPAKKQNIAPTSTSQVIQPTKSITTDKLSPLPSGSVQKFYYIPKNKIDLKDNDGALPSFYIAAHGSHTVTFSDTSGKKYKPFFYEEALEKNSNFYSLPDSDPFKQQVLSTMYPIDDVDVYMTGDVSFQAIVSPKSPNKITMTLGKQFMPAGVDVYYGYGTPESALVKLVYTDLAIADDIHMTFTHEGLSPFITSSDKIYPPTFYSDTGKAIDMTPPVITMAQRTVENGEEITLKAQDDASEVKEIRYSLRDNIYLFYTAPFVVNKNTVRTINVFADDTAGNRSPLRSFPIQ